MTTLRLVDVKQTLRVLMQAGTYRQTATLAPLDEGDELRGVANTDGCRVTLVGDEVIVERDNASTEQIVTFEVVHKHTPTEIKVLG